MLFSDAQNKILKFFAPAKVRKAEHVWEKMTKREGWKWVLVLHNLNWQDSAIIHTKIILKTDIAKQELLDLEFSWLYDLNCKYHTQKFKDLDDLEIKIRDIILKSQFGPNLKSLSKFIQRPTIELNDLLFSREVTDWSFYDIDYDPKFTITKCELTRFDFTLTLNGVYNAEMTVRKQTGQFEIELTLDQLRKKYYIDELAGLMITIVLWIEKEVDAKLRGTE